MKYIFLTFLTFITTKASALNIDYNLDFSRESQIRYSGDETTAFVFKSHKLINKSSIWHARLKESHSSKTFKKTSRAFGTAETTQEFQLNNQCSGNFQDKFNKIDCLVFNEDGSFKNLNLELPYSYSTWNQTQRSDFASLRNERQSMFKARVISRETTIESEIKDQELKINIFDLLTPDQRVEKRDIRFQNDKINGSIQIDLSENESLFSYYKVTDVSGILAPKFSDCDKIKQTVRNTSKSISCGNTKISSTNAKEVASLDSIGKWQTFWRTPGDNKKITYVFDNLGLSIANGRTQNIGSISIYEKNFSITNLNKNLDLSSPSSFKSAINFLDTFSVNENSNFLDARNLLFKLLDNKELREKIIASLSIKDLNTFMDTLNEISLNNYPEPERSDYSHVGWDIKAASQILAIELARESISSLKKYCNKIDFQKIDGSTKEISGLFLASFYVNRTLNRLSSFKFNEFTPLFTYMKELNQQGLSYSEVRNDKDKISRIRDVFELLKSSGLLKESPFGIAYNELNYLKKQFGDLNSQGMKLSEVLNKMQNLEQKVDAVRKEVMSKLRSFQPNNKEIVDFSELSEKSAVIALEITQLSKDMSGLFGVQSNSISVDNSSQARKDFIQFIINTITKHLSIFEINNNNVSINKYLKAYRKHYGIDQTLTDLKSCLFME